MLSAIDQNCVSAVLLADVIYNMFISCDVFVNWQFEIG